MIYVDTSAFVPMFIREPKSDSVIDWLESSQERLAISDWTLVEFASATAIKIRTGQTSPTIVERATARANEFATTYCAVATPGRDEYRFAADLAGEHMLKLRAGDALHLALARSLRARAILCLDEDMAKGAEAVGMRTVTL